MGVKETIESLIGRLAQLGFWKCPRDVLGARADEVFTAELARLVQEFPVALKSPDWIDFLRQYGGGVWAMETQRISAGMYGLSNEASMHLLDGPGDPVEYGCLLFGDLILPERVDDADTISLGFGFEATGTRRSGVYRIRDRRAEWYCDTFAQWLERLVEKQGHLAG